MAKKEIMREIVASDIYEDIIKTFYKLDTGEPIFLCVTHPLEIWTVEWITYRDKSSADRAFMELYKAESIRGNASKIEYS